jgi:excisionase family DNA binding protein
MEPQCLTVPQVAQQLQVSRVTVYELCAQGKLRHVRLGAKDGTIRIREQDLRTFLESKVNR